MGQSSIWESLWKLWKYVLGVLALGIVVGIFIEVFNVGIVFSLTVVFVIVVTVFLFRKARAEE